MTGEKPMTCDEALRLLAGFLDGELDGVSQAAVERHLDLCRGCYSRAEFERRLKAEIGRLGREDVPSGFESRVRGIIDSFTQPAAEPADGP